MHTITRSYEFSAAHILVGHPKCGRLHGHNYVVEVTVGETLGGPVSVYAWVMDFKELDSIVRPNIERLDHRFIVTLAGEDHLIRAEPIHYVRTTMSESTAECIAGWFASMIVLPEHIRLVQISVWETPRSCATWMPISP